MKNRSPAAAVAVLLMLLVGAATADRLPSTAGSTERAASVNRQPVQWVPARRDRDAADSKPLAYATRDLRGVFAPEQDVRGEQVYIVLFEEPALAAYRGGIPGLKATSPRGAGRLDAKSDASVAYLGYLSAKQADYRGKIAAKIGRAEIESTYRYALNGFAIRMTQQEAAELASIPGVTHIERERIRELDTDRGPVFIGASDVWDGTATGGLDAQGEGIIIGIIDSGVNGASPANGRDVHPSFAAVGGDGFVHTNPLSGYLGECEVNAGLCNDKLIGRYSFLDDPLTQPGDPPSQDTDGHGSHVMSTAGGNVLMDVAIIDADGNPGTFTFDRISGVAPHANLIAYKVCAPGCPTSAINDAIDQSVADGVDVINMSISGGTASPWEDSTAIAFRNARAAGIFAATSAGNDGPIAGTAAVDKNAPWVLSVAASTHDRGSRKELTNFSGGNTPPPADIIGTGLTVGYTGPIVYAGDFQNSNAMAEQCLQPFPPDTWTNGEIVVCDRGTIARVAKCQNVRDGGAAGCVLANVDPDSDGLNHDPHVIPAIHVTIADGDALKSWLASGNGHMARITTGIEVPDPAASDVLAAFSSRGPAGFDFLVPNVAAPGVDIFAAGADLRFDHPGIPTADPTDDPSVPTAFGIISGTSMASPHAAASAALLRQVHPDWTDAEIHSALVSTAEPDILNDDGVTPADANDVGGGRIRVDVAAIAGLVLDETQANFVDADPANGGDPASLNLALLSSRNCLETCSFERTVRATTGGTWDTSATGGILSVNPAQFTLAAGGTQVLAIDVDASAVMTGEFTFDRVVLTPQDPALPVQQLPVAIQPSSGNIPDTVEIDAPADSGSQSIPAMTLAVTQFDAQVTGLDEAAQTSITLAEDSDTDPFNNPGDGTSTTFFNVPGNAVRVVAETFDSESPDVDLFVGVDFNMDGMVQVTNDPLTSELVCFSASPAADEICDVAVPSSLPALPWWVVLQNFQASEQGAIDEVTLATTVVDGNDEGNLTVGGPGGAVPTGQPYDITLAWDDDMDVGDIFYGIAEIGSDPSTPGDLARIAVRLERVSSVSFTSTPVTDASVGDAYSAGITADDAQGDGVTFSAPVLPGWLALIDNGDGTATLSGTPAADNLGANPVSIAASDGTETTTQDFVIAVADTSPPVITLNGASTMRLTVGQAFDDPGATATDDVDGDLSAAIVTTGNVNTQAAGTYMLNYDVTDSSGNAAATVTRTVNVSAGGSGGGAGGLVSLMLLIPLLGRWSKHRSP